MGGSENVILLVDVASRNSLTAALTSSSGTASVMASTIASRGLLTLGIHCQRVCRSVSLIQVREKKRWMKAYTHLMAKKLKLEGPPPPQPR